ncbi:hypothetical protein C8R44DRAFT_799150 [Mycena epipterygia]|nr:hypothetical protein C8R44DRAFT_799150 [Mycena epipterygia]
MLTTTITQNGVPAYKVSTNQHGSTTEIRTTGTDALIARIVRKELLPDTASFPDVSGGKAMRTSRWLKRATLADGLPAGALETEIGTCFLRRHPVQGLSLYRADMVTIVTQWQPRTAESPLALIIAAGMERSHTLILAAFLYEEQRLRIMEKNGKVQEERLLFTATYENGMFQGGSSG